MSNLLRAEHVSAIETWSAPQIEGASTGRRPRTVREMQEAEEAVWRAVREEAHAEALAAAKADIARLTSQLEQQAQRFGALLELLARPLARLDNDVEQQLAELATAIARQLVRRELRADPAQIIAVVRETVGLLPASAREVRVMLHPDDASLVREKLVAPQSAVAWTLLEDPMMARGDCRVTTETAQIDARLEKRLAAAITAVLGDERAEDRQRAREQADQQAGATGEGA